MHYLIEHRVLSMVFRLDDNSKTVASIRSNLCHLICLRHLIRSKRVTKQIYFAEKTYFPACKPNIFFVTMSSPFFGKNSPLHEPRVYIVECLTKSISMIKGGGNTIADLLQILHVGLQLSLSDAIKPLRQLYVNNTVPYS